jgi:hypothetical protein
MEREVGAGDTQGTEQRRGTTNILSSNDRYASQGVLATPDQVVHDMMTRSCRYEENEMARAVRHDKTKPLCTSCVCIDSVTIQCDH